MNPLKNAPNLGALHGALIIEELVRLGVRRFYLSPGSRSAPLAVAAAEHPLADVTIRVDERGSAFQALGAARGSGIPSVVITTSGTAVANLYPAVIEASMDGLPLILLTADRPPELHGVGANQTIPQAEMFGRFTRHASSLGAPGPDYEPLATLHAIGAAYQAAVGPRAGPVQINCPFREPLAPTPSAWDPAILDPIEDWIDGDEPLPLATADGAAPPAADEQDLASAIRQARRGLLVLGTLDPAGREAASSLAEHLGWAVHADLRSGYRLGTAFPGLLPHLDRVLAEAPDSEAPDVIVQMGGRLISKRLRRLFERNLHEHYVLIDDAAQGTDPTQHVTRHLAADPGATARELLARLSDLEPVSPPQAWAQQDARVEDLLTSAFANPHLLSEPYVARFLSEQVDAEHALFIANSMPIRDMQSFAARTGPRVPLAANRGASGIDGIVSSAIGYAEGTDRPTTLLIGDLSLLHDLNGLGCLAHAKQPLTIIVVNNRGGGIFAFLPIADHEALFNPYFETPHDLTFEHIANAFGLRYFSATTPTELAEGYRTAIAFSERALVEVRSGVAENKQRHAEIEATIRATLAADPT